MRGWDYSLEALGELVLPVSAAGRARAVSWVVAAVVVVEPEGGLAATAGGLRAWAVPAVERRPTLA
jgi:hypothetical protein